MHRTTIHIKTDIQTRDAAKKVADEFGFTLSSLVNAFLKQIARKKRLTLSLEEEPTPQLLEQVKKAEEDIKAGRTRSFKTPEDALAYVASLIEDDQKQTKAAD